MENRWSGFGHIAGVGCARRPLLDALQAAPRESVRSGALRVGPFLARFDAHSDNPHVNYAVPDGGAVPACRRWRASR
ncbi:hypothetical protein [Saccharothrix yanglingensis]|uniref:Uncharacterized protein n=1 Tax=Saccharothrix yanglingensis TaxID=659496 RepID=A0ABU0X5P3_9PSEU|nr:hypothetical protein [Saccharothrix yanglingensis]MDQ2585919.1 hypothetical protein [Saccharothrix yanglingensis]